MSWAWIKQIISINLNIYHFQNWLQRVWIKSLFEGKINKQIFFIIPKAFYICYSQRLNIYDLMTCINHYSHINCSLNTLKCWYEWPWKCPRQGQLCALHICNILEAVVWDALATTLWNCGENIWVAQSLCTKHSGHSKKHKSC